MVLMHIDIDRDVFHVHVERETRRSIGRRRTPTSPRPSSAKR